MADQSEKGLATVFDLLKISLTKTDPTLDKSNALKGLVVAAVGRAEAAGELKGGNPNQIATDVCITLRHLTGGRLAAGEPCSNTGLKVRPYVSVTKLCKWMMTMLLLSHLQKQLKVLLLPNLMQTPLLLSMH